MLQAVWSWWFKTDEGTYYSPARGISRWATSVYMTPSNGEHVTAQTATRNAVVD